MKTQIWTAVSIYVLVAVIKKELQLNASLYQLLQILSVTLFEKMPLQEALSGIEPHIQDRASNKQLSLQGF